MFGEGFLQRTEQGKTSVIFFIKKFLHFLWPSSLLQKLTCKAGEIHCDSRGAPVVVWIFQREVVIYYTFFCLLKWDTRAWEKISTHNQINVCSLSKLENTLNINVIVLCYNCNIIHRSAGVWSVQTLVCWGRW